MTKLYAQRNYEDLEPFFTDHVFAMTAENLGGKAAIAGELAFRDVAIQNFKNIANVLHGKLKERDISFGQLVESTLATTRKLTDATTLLETAKFQIGVVENQVSTLQDTSTVASASFEELVGILSELNATDIEDVNTLIEEIRNNI